MKKNVTKKELIEELIEKNEKLKSENSELREQIEIIKEWFSVSDKKIDFIKFIYKNKRMIIKICLTLAILFLCASCYILGLLS